MMEFNKAILQLSQEFPTMICACGIEFIVLGVLRGKSEYDEEIVNHVYQQAKTVYCPYCGKRGVE